MFYNNEELKELAKEVIKELLHTWEIVYFDTTTGRYWVQYSYEAVNNIYRWVGYIFSKDPEDLDARDQSNYLNRFDEPEYLGVMVF